MDIKVGKKYYHIKRRVYCKIIYVYQNELRGMAKVEILNDDYVLVSPQWVYKIHLVPAGLMTEILYED